VFDLLLPLWTRRLIVYPAAIDTRWGPERLRAACERDLGVELDRATAVLFYNRTKDTLVLYTLDADGDRCIKKYLVRGAFLVPVPAKGQKYVVVDASKISKLFQGPEKAVAGRRDAKKTQEAPLRPIRVETSARQVRPKRLMDDELAEMIEEAIVDAYGPSEQISGFYTKIEDHLELPFSTKILGVDVVVEKIDLTRSDEIVASCKRGRERQTIPILDLPLPTPAPKGAAWIEAYRHWVSDGLE
jgi:hypothetical protein